MKQNNPFLERKYYRFLIIVFAIISSKSYAQVDLTSQNTNRDGLVHTLHAGFLKNIDLSGDSEKCSNQVNKKTLLISKNDRIFPNLTPEQWKVNLISNQSVEKNLQQTEIHFVPALNLGDTEKFCTPYVELMTGSRPIPIENKSHLIFIIPGFGATSESGQALAFARALNMNGYSTVTLDSPASQRFITDTSTTGVPGLQSQDARDLLEGIIRITGDLAKNQNFKFKKISIIGLSLGGINAAHIEIVLKTEKSLLTKYARKIIDHFNLTKIITVNAPLSSSFGLYSIDQMIDIYINRPRNNLFQASRKMFALYPYSPLSFQEYNQLFYALQSSRLTNRDIKILIGFSFFDSVKGAFNGLSQRHANHWKLSPKENYKHFIEIFENVSKFFLTENNHLFLEKLKETKNEKIDFTIQENLISNKIQTQSLSNQTSWDKLNSYNELDSQSILGKIDILKQSSRYRYISFSDDFLINKNHIDQIETLLKKKAEIFRDGGGHLGGILKDQFLNTLLEMLDPKEPLERNKNEKSY